ncbi:MAG TPA: hypothetical protein VK858_11235 [Longimicrobiales bacterium]|nr:hypothetical protein [Longimicrobiales bacterium]
MILLYAHSGIRYLVLLTGVAVVLFALAGVVGRKPYDPRMRVLSGVFAMFMHLNVLLGLALLFTRPFAPYLIGHISLMIFAAVAAQVVPSVMRRRPVEERTWMPHLVGAAVALGLVVAGLMAIQAPLFGSRYS